ncbi:MAG: hydrolase TatD [Planctomycetes bacterium]|nr:hydrolase TatD [Planctomycetota bacterium]
MPIFEPHAHMISRVTDDYERMAAAGVKVVLEPAFWLGQPRTSVGSFVDYFDTLVGFERYRAAQFGIHHVCTFALNPREANDPRVNEAVLEILPRYLEKGGVVGVGELGLDEMTATEDRYFEAQVELARRHDLPLLVHTPHRNKRQGFQRCLDMVRGAGFPMQRVLLDHGNEETIELTMETGVMQGFSIYPKTKMDPPRMVALLQKYGVERISINSACDWGISDPLSVPKTVALMQQAGFSTEQITRVVWRNPVEFFAQTGRCSEAEWLTPPATAPLSATGSTILRGGGPRSEGCC